MSTWLIAASVLYGFMAVYCFLVGIIAVLSDDKDGLIYMAGALLWPLLLLWIHRDDDAALPWSRLGRVQRRTLKAEQEIKVLRARMEAEAKEHELSRMYDRYLSTPIES